MSSWGHSLRVLTDAERDARLQQEWPCGIHGCKEMPTHATRYRYVTGRAGRTAWAERKVCDEHAAKFGRKHSVVAVEAPPPVHAIQQAVRQLLGGES